MTQQEIHAEAPLPFLAALVYTLREIEETQPEPGFKLFISADISDAVGP